MSCYLSRSRLFLCFMDETTFLDYDVGIMLDCKLISKNYYLPKKPLGREILHDFDLSDTTKTGDLISNSQQQNAQIQGFP